ncbi:MAG: dihydrofolate reductase [Actinomycetota bacterium]|jgi:dihydrofolate reductase|nr:dihydrofolate reductase [Actinomycetota bacterium]
MTAPASTVTLVAAVARNGVIGRDGGLPWHLPGEQARFKALTMGHVLVMGRRTYESIGRPLPGRTTVVVTRQPDWQPDAGLPDGLLVTGSVDAALTHGRQLDEHVFVAGGAQVYADALPFADTLLLTLVDAEPEGDTYFPAVDWAEWSETWREAHEEWSLVCYERRSREPDR